MIKFKDLSSKQNFIFDCDGVILDSNRFKTDAYYEILKEYDEKKARDFILFHRENAGISRFVKFEIFFKEYLPVEDYKEQAKICSDAYAKRTVQLLKEAKVNDGFLEFYNKIQGRKYIVSGGALIDLIEVFKHKKMDHLFDGIYGSPLNKYQIFEKLKLDPEKSIYFGDGRFDYEVASHFNISFVFMKKLTEFSNWKEYFASKNVPILDDFTEIVE